jgi:hypothetical protein
MRPPKPPQRPATFQKNHSLKLCPWCGGRLAFEPRFPLVRLIPGDVHRLKDVEAPEPMRTVAAWVCQTPNCRFREKA